MCSLDSGDLPDLDVSGALGLKCFLIYLNSRVCVFFFFVIISKFQNYCSSDRNVVLTTRTTTLSVPKLIHFFIFRPLLVAYFLVKFVENHHPYPCTRIHPCALWFSVNFHQKDSPFSDNHLRFHRNFFLTSARDMNSPAYI